MTSEQKAWLDAHPEYRPLAAGGAPQGDGAGNVNPIIGGLGVDPNFKNRGTLHPDGRFVPGRVTNEAGAFGVGTYKIPQEPGRIDPTDPQLNRGFRRPA